MAKIRETDNTKLVGNIATILENSLAVSYEVNAEHQANNSPPRYLLPKKESIGLQKDLYTQRLAA